MAHSSERCSFCRKSADSARRMVSGQGNLRICDECILVCRQVIDGSRASLATHTGFLSEMKPSAIRAYLDEHVIGQERAKRVLSVAVYNHFKRIREDSSDDDETELSKGNILMIGPTGSGKTLIARTLAKKLGVPLTIADATSLTEAGYVGEDVESIVKNLWIAAEQDIELAGRGVVCIDEVDKIARQADSPSPMRDVGGEGVQQALLKVVESESVRFQPDGGRNRPGQEMIEVDTTNVLFVCCGSFDGLVEIIERRVSRSSIGFGADPSLRRANRSELLAQVQPEDLIRYGLIPEFVGRLPVIVTLDELAERELVEVLWRPKNALIRQYQRLFELEQVKLKVHHEAMVAVVREAIQRKSGARGLRAILEEIMLEVMYEIPSMEGIRECVITEETVEQRRRPLLLPEPEAA